MVTSVDLLGATLDIELYASEVIVDETGVFIGLGTVMDAPWDSSCVSDGEDDDGEPLPPPGVSLLASAWPEVGETPWGGAGDLYDVGLLVNADLMDMALYTIWQAGLLCIDVGDLSPVPIGTTFLTSLYGESFGELFPEDQEATFGMSSDGPPTAVFTDAALAGLRVEALHLDTVSDLTHRASRIVRTDIAVDLDIGAEILDGALVLDLALDPALWGYTEVSHELVPEGYSEGLVAGLPTLIESFLPASLLPTVPLPAFNGIGVGDVFFEPTPNAQWQGVFMVLDVDAVEPLELDGCSGGCDGGGGLDLESALGCDDAEGCGGCAGGEEGCDAGCEGTSCSTPGRGGGRLVLVLATLGLALRRRRGPAAR
jgi:hypothetical protein